jgi:hypothetical protein
MSLRAALRKLGTEVCLLLEDGVTLLPLAERHVPDPALVAEGLVLGYLALCPVTGLPRPRGLRIARAEKLAQDPPPDVVLPIILGQLPAMPDAVSALHGGLADAGQGIPPLFATLGQDAAFGSYWVLGSLLARTRNAPSGPVLADLAQRPITALDAEIQGLAQELSRQTGTPVPLWSAEESRAVKRLIPTTAPRPVWLAAADSLQARGPAFLAMADMLRATAASVWGNDPLPA